MLGNLENAGTEIPKRKKTPVKPKAKPAGDRHPIVDVTKEFEQEFSAATVFDALDGMDDDDLDAVHGHLTALREGRRAERLAKLQAEAAALGATVKLPGKGKGQAAPVKYRGPNGETWAGRGMKPVWLREAIERGANLDDYLV